MVANEILSAEYSYVSLIIEGSKCDPFKVTEMLGVQPTRAHKKDDPHISLSKKGKAKKYAPFSSGLWALDSQCDCYSSIETHIVEVLEHLEGKESVLLELRSSGLKVKFYCSFFLSGMHQSYIFFDNKTLAKLAAMEIDLDIDLYS